jgi:23S rRNA (uracil1939-C5)-methyltransferase
MKPNSGAPRLKKNQICQVEITDLNNLGYGVGRVDGLVTFIAGAVPGDTVSARIIKVASGYAVARLETLLSPSPNRIPDPDCKSAGCGGCVYRQVSYGYELELKHRYIVECFRKQGLPDVEILPPLHTGKTEHYRNKAQYPVALTEDGRITAGFFKPRSHRVIPAEGCPLAPRVFEAIVRRIIAWAEEHQISVYDEKTGKGLLRHIYLRTSADEREILVTIVANGRALPAEDALTGALREGFSSIVGVLLNINTEATNVICGREYRTLYGKSELDDTLCGVRLSLSPASFYQVNHDAAELLYRTAASLAELKGSETLVDLFCGVGSIGLSMASQVREVIGIEIVADAVRCAERNAAQNGIANARFFVGDATDTEQLLAAAERELGRTLDPDVVILDPPRKGADSRLLAFLAARQIPRIVYISCNPETLARDLAILRPLGYEISPVTPVDLFPRTGHVESVVCLTRRLDNELRERMN